MCSFIYRSLHYLVLSLPSADGRSLSDIQPDPSSRLRTARCRPGFTLRFDGLVTFDGEGRPLPTDRPVCQAVLDIWNSVKGKCHSRTSCDMKPSERILHQETCPGVRKVAFEVVCARQKPAGNLEFVD